MLVRTLFLWAAGGGGFFQGRFRTDFLKQQGQANLLVSGVNNLPYM